jgi:hypothetical protein
MARNRDSKGIQDGHSRVRQTGFECRQPKRIFKGYEPQKIRAISKWRFLILARGGPGRTALPPFGWMVEEKGMIGFILSARKT